MLNKPVKRYCRNCNIRF